MATTTIKMLLRGFTGNCDDKAEGDCNSPCTWGQPNTTTTTTPAASNAISQAARAALTVATEVVQIAIGVQIARAMIKPTVTATRAVFGPVAPRDTTRSILQGGIALEACGVSRQQYMGRAAVH